MTPTPTPIPSPPTPQPLPLPDSLPPDLTVRVSAPAPAAAESWHERSLSLLPGQRKLLLALFAIVAAYAGVRLAIDRRPITDPPPPRGNHWADLADRLDPNTATADEWAALPGVGEKRAKSIVTQRDALRARSSDGIPFHEPRDLLKLNGIGRSMTEQLKPFLNFPGSTAMMPAAR